MLNIIYNMRVFYFHSPNIFRVTPKIFNVVSEFRFAIHYSHYSADEDEDEDDVDLLE